MAAVAHRIPLCDMTGGHTRLNLSISSPTSELNDDGRTGSKSRQSSIGRRHDGYAHDTAKQTDQAQAQLAALILSEQEQVHSDTNQSRPAQVSQLPIPSQPHLHHDGPSHSNRSLSNHPQHYAPGNYSQQATPYTSQNSTPIPSPRPDSLAPTDSENIDDPIHPSEADEYLQRVASQVPLDAGHKTEIWRAGREVGACIIEHFLRYQDPTRWRSAGIHNAAAYLTTNLKNLRRTLSANIPVCQMLATLRAEREDIALCIDGRTLQSLAARLQGMHAAVVLGCQTFLARVLRVGWEQGVDNPRAKVQSIVNDYLNLVNLVKHLPLDGSHWGHLWGGGERIARCIIQHYLQHENPSQWEQRNIRQPSNHLRRNIQNLRDMLMGSPIVCDMLLDLATARYDIAVCIDSRTMQFLANRLRNVHPQLVHDCKEHLMKELRVGWSGGLRNPRAAVLSVARRFFEECRSREWQGGIHYHEAVMPQMAHMMPQPMFHAVPPPNAIMVPVSLPPGAMHHMPPGSMPLMYSHNH